MKSKWLPTFPLHAANWLADPRVQMLKPVAKSELLEALLRSWMLGKAVVVKADIAEAYGELWPEYEAVRNAHHDAYEKKVEQRRAAAEARWNSLRGAAVRNAARMRPASPPQCGTEGTITLTEEPVPNTKEPEPNTLVPPDKPAVQRESWITPYVELWRQRTCGEMVVKHALKPLSKLRNQHGDDRVLDAWQRYLEQTEVQFCSVTHFASKYGQWAGTAEPPRPPEYDIGRQLASENPNDDPFMKVRLLS